MEFIILCIITVFGAWLIVAWPMIAKKFLASSVAPESANITQGIMAAVFLLLMVHTITTAVKGAF